MAWIYLAESEESPWPCLNGSSPSPIVKSTDTHKAYCSQECEQDNCQSHLYGMMCARFPERMFWDRWTLSTAAFHARTSVLRDLESAWAASEADFFSTSQGLSEKQTRDLYFSKTSQQLELVASTVSRKHLPSSGMIAGGRLYQPQKLAIRKSKERDGLCWPRPKSMDWKDWNYKKCHGRHQPRLPIFLWKHLGGFPTVQVYEWTMNFPDQWTKLEPWATEWIGSKRKSRLKD